MAALATGDRLLPGFLSHRTSVQLKNHVDA
jgi:hypothetical protein